MKAFGLSPILIILTGIAMGPSQSAEKNQNALVESSEFATKLFSVLCNQESSKAENILISPLSIISSLVLLKAGATKLSANYFQLENLLGVSILDGAQSLYELYPIESLSKSGVELNMATSLWTDSLKQSYIELTKTKLLSQAFSLPKNNLFVTINEWVSNQTKGMINQLFDPSTPLDPNLVAVLVNIVYFKGRWLKKFDEDKTVDGEFYGRLRNLPARYMTATRVMRVIKHSEILGGASVVMLDYGKNESAEDPPEFSAIFMLPYDSSDASMSNLISGLQLQPISDIIKHVGFVDTILKLPRFKLKYGPSSLVEVFKQLGMKDAFDSTKSELFNEMTNDPRTYIDEIFHGSAIEVTEEGTVAASATGAVLKTRRLLMHFKLTFNRPFVISIIHRPSGMPLFIGRIENPELIFGDKTNSKKNNDEDEL